MTITIKLVPKKKIDCHNQVLKRTTAIIDRKKLPIKTTISFVSINVSKTHIALGCLHYYYQCKSKFKILFTFQSSH